MELKVSLWLSDECWGVMMEGLNDKGQDSPICVGDAKVNFSLLIVSTALYSI